MKNINFYIFNCYLKKLKETKIKNTSKLLQKKNYFENK